MTLPAVEQWSHSAATAPHGRRHATAQPRPATPQVVHGGLQQLRQLVERAGTGLRLNSQAEPPHKGDKDKLIITSAENAVTPACTNAASPFLKPAG